MFERKRLQRLGMGLSVLLVLGLFVFFYPFSGSVRESEKMEQPVVKAENAKQKKDFFIDYRMERERLRSRQAELLDSIIREGAVDGESRKTAVERLDQLTKKAETELHIEQMIKARGYEEALAVMGDKCIDIIVRPNTLAEPEVQMIGALVIKNTGFNLQQVVIMCKSS